MNTKLIMLLLLTAVNFIAVATTDVLNNPPMSPPPYIIKYGTGAIVAECTHDSVTYAFRTSNGTCPGYVPNSNYGMKVHDPSLPECRDAEVEVTFW